MEERHDAFAENFIDGHRVLPVLLADLAAAERVIHLSMFLFFDDPIGEQIERVLEARARAGVAVRVLLNVEKTRLGDPFSTGEERMMEIDPHFHRNPTDVSAMCHRLRDAGVEVIDTDLDYDKVIETGEFHLDELAREIRGSIDVDEMHIDHRKLVIVDGRVGWCGSANFGAQYLFHRAFDPEREAHDEAREAIDHDLPEPWWKWHDGLVRFEGSIVHDLDVAFRERWLLGGGDDFQPIVAPSFSRRGIPLRSARVIKNEPSSRTNEIRLTFVERIRSAERRIVIENPYVYHPAIIEALCEAKRARPQLHVTMVVPARKWNDNAFAQDAMQHHYPALLEAGVELFEYQNHFTHLKLASFDGRLALVGSANLNYRSLEDDKDFECCVLCDGEDFASSVEHGILADLPASRRITLDTVRGFSLRAARMRLRDPRTLAMIAAREL